MEATGIMHRYTPTPAPMRLPEPWQVRNVPQHKEKQDWKETIKQKTNLP
jgi:hypothetical protein